MTSCRCVSSARSGWGRRTRPPYRPGASGRATCSPSSGRPSRRPVPAEVVLDLAGRRRRRLRRRRAHGGRAPAPPVRRRVVPHHDAGYVVPVDVGPDAERFTALAAAAREARTTTSWRARTCAGGGRALWSGATAYEGLRDDLVMAERVRLEELLRRVRRPGRGLLAAGRARAVAEAMAPGAGLSTQPARRGGGRAGACGRRTGSVARGRRWRSTRAAPTLREELGV